jgi:hypothetical protein
MAGTALPLRHKIKASTRIASRTMYRRQRAAPRAKFVDPLWGGRNGLITFAFGTGRGIIDTLDRLVAGTYWGQVAVNHLRERVNMTHVVLSLPAIIIAVIFVGIPLNWILGGTRTALQRMIAIISVPATVVLAVALFTFNALVPETYAALCGLPTGFGRDH